MEIDFHKQEKNHYLRINEKYIGKEEINFTATNLRAIVISNIQSQYGIAYDDKFWDTTIDGTTPKHILQDKVIEVLVRNAMYEEVLREKALLQYEDFESFNKLLEDVNKERQAAVSRKEVIYGPVCYTQFDYYNYLMSNNIIKLKELYLDSGEIEITDEKLRGFEKQNPNIISQDPDILKTKLLYARFVNEDGVVDEECRKSAKEVMHEVYELLENGTKFEEVIEKYADKIYLEEKVFGGDTNRTDLMTYGELMYELRELEENTYTPVIQGNGAYNIALLIEHIKGNKRPFEEYKDFLTLKYIDDWFEEMINQKVDSADVEILKPLLKWF